VASASARSPARASVVFAGSRSVNSYVSHSWYSALLGFVFTRSASCFGSYQKLPHESASLEKMTVHSSGPGMK